MTVVARRIASVPVRLASETWQKAVDLLASSDSAVREELLGVSGIASSLVTREAMKESPIVVSGNGPRVRIYCVYGEKAIEGTGVNEAALADSPVKGEAWAVSLPCPPDDLAWVQANLAQLSSRITARDMADRRGSEPEDDTLSTAATINLDSFRRP